MPKQQTPTEALVIGLLLLAFSLMGLVLYGLLAMMFKYMPQEIGQVMQQMNLQLEDLPRSTMFISALGSLVGACYIHSLADGAQPRAAALHSFCCLHSCRENRLTFYDRRSEQQAGRSYRWQCSGHGLVWNPDKHGHHGSGCLAVEPS